MGIRSQSMLGNVQRENRRDLDMGGMLMFGQVTKVYPKYHTADVQLLNQQYGSLLSLESNEGKYACKILENYAGVDSDLDVCYGSVTPIQVGCYVLVGFINNKKSQPVILGCIHDSAVGKLLPDEYPLTDSSELYRKLVVNRSQDYFTINGSGDLDLVHHSGAFITGRTSDLDEDDFDERDLQLHDKIETPNRFSPFSIFSMIRTFAGKIKFIIKNTTGLIRLHKVDGENSEYESLAEMSDDGKIRIKIKNSNTTSEVVLDTKTGDIVLLQTGESGSNEVTLDSKTGVRIKSSMSVSINTEGSFSVSADEIKLNDKVVE